MKGTARVAFLAHRAEIEAELEAGWPMKAVYQKRSEKLGMSYQQFARYVNSVIRAAQQSAPPAPAAPSAKPSGPAAQVPERAGTPPLPSQGPSSNAGHAGSRPGRTFEFDGNPKPDDKERLLGIKPRDPKG